MVDIERLRSAWGRTGVEEAEHLDEEVWERLANDEMGAPEREAALGHILGCAECSRVYRAVLSVRREAHTFDPGAPAPRVRSSRFPAPRRGGLLTGLAAAAAVLLAFLVVRPHFLQEPAAPGGAGPDTLRSARVVGEPVPLGPLGRLQAAPSAFWWEPVDGARGYRVELLDGDGETLWRSPETVEPRLPWPDGVVRSPGRYYWRVLAVPAGGGGEVASPLVVFDITSSPR